ncbi:MAG: Gmad2 immunoglobulin-like domain-containing protein [Patescibacteria group bacterium]
MKKTIWLGIGILVVAGLVYAVVAVPQAEAPTGDLPIIDGSQVGQPEYENSSPDDIVVTLPFPGAVTGKDFSVRGRARGTWFFEASFPVFLIDEEGNQLAVALASPEPPGTEWMTSEFIGFKADMVVPADFTGPALLILQNDNPSGLPENQKTVSFPIIIEY